MKLSIGSKVQMIWEQIQVHKQERNSELENIVQHLVERDMSENVNTQQNLPLPRGPLRSRGYFYQIRKSTHEKKWFWDRTEESFIMKNVEQNYITSQPYGALFIHENSNGEG